MKRTISTGLLILFLTLTGSAWGQALPRDEQQFCSAFPAFREALKQENANSISDSPRQQRQLKQAVSAAAKDFKRSAGWKSSSQPVRGWVGDLHSIAESTAWGHHLGVSVKLFASGTSKRSTDFVFDIPSSFTMPRTLRRPNRPRGAISFHKLMLDDPWLNQQWRRVSELEILVCVPGVGQSSRFLQGS